MHDVYKHIYIYIYIYVYINCNLDEQTIKAIDNLMYVSIIELMLIN
jgi:hypothetical protein